MTPRKWAVSLAALVLALPASAGTDKREYRPSTVAGTMLLVTFVPDIALWLPGHLGYV
jgi:hypothetical protein